MARNKVKESNTPILLMIIGSIIILGVVIWQTSRILDRAAPTAAPSSPSSGFLPYPDVERITLEDAKAAFDAGTAVFLDVRDAESYAAGHISGAVNIDYSDVESRLAEMNPSDHIITYCT